MASTPNNLRYKSLSLYRSLLRELPSRPLSHPSPLKQRLRNRFLDEPLPSSSSSSSTLGSTSTSSPATPSTTSRAEGAGLRDATSTRPPAEVLEEKIQVAEQFLAYVRAQRMYVTLLERYNPGVEMNQEERVRLTARRVGMNLPIANNSNEDGGGNDNDNGGKGSVSG